MGCHAKFEMEAPKHGMLKSANEDLDKILEGKTEKIQSFVHYLTRFEADLGYVPKIKFVANNLIYNFN